MSQSYQVDEMQKVEMVSRLTQIVQCTDQEAQKCLQQNKWNETHAIDDFLTNPQKYTASSGGNQGYMGEDQQMAEAMQQSMMGNQNIAGVNDQDYDLNRVLMQSIQEQKNNISSSAYEPLNPEQRRRDSGAPCGLKNIGNTCYFNSLLQVYFNIPRFVQEILEFKDDGQRLAPPGGQQAQGASSQANEPAQAQQQQQINDNPQDSAPVQDPEVKQFLDRLESSRELVRNLKVLFGQMTKSYKKYADPTHVLRSLTDDLGKPVEIGEEKDIGEFNDTFLSRVQEGLNYKQLYKEMCERKGKAKSEQQARAAGENSQDGGGNSQGKAKAPDLGLRPQDSSINFDDNDVDPKVDQDMKDEQIKEKKQEDVIEVVGKEVFKGMDVITKDFMGRTKQVMTYSHSDGKKHSRQKVLDSFAAVMVRVVGFKELYEAWENQSRSEIENFQETADGASQNVKQIDWIDQAPKVLCLQLNRLDYKDAEPFKHRHKVAIEKTLFIDRFMIQNSERSQQLSNHVAKLRDQIKMLEQSIKEYTSFGGSDYDIRQMLTLVGDFFEKQNHKDKVNQEIAGASADKVKYHQPFKDQIAPADKTKAGDAVKLMRKYHTQLQQQVSQMEQQVRDLESQIKAAFGIPEMQKMPYSLHSICVHDGNAMSGHYFTFIYDRFQKKWRKFNDIRVTDVTEEEVFKSSEGGDSWQTAYWLVYVEGTIASELDKTNINCYQEPADPFVLGDYKHHAYGSRVPAEVNTQIEKENQALAKEIDDQKNSKIVNELRALYGQRYNEMKSEFSGAAARNSLGLKCYAAYQWYRNEHDVLKRLLLAEAYHDVLSGKEDGAYPADITALDPSTSLFKAIQEGVRGNQDYPASQLTLSEQERAAIQDDARLYAQSYMDAYVVSAQCGLLETTPFALAAGEANPTPAGVFTDEIFARLQTETDLVIFICYDTYLRNQMTFGGADPKPLAGIEKVTSYRQLQRDSARCYLLLMLVVVKAYLGKAGEDLKKGQLKKADVAHYVVDKLQKLKYGIALLAHNDIHVDQIGIVLRGALKTSKPVLDAAEITNDFQYVTEFMLAPQNRGKPLDMTKLSPAAKSVPDYSAGNAAEQMLPKEYARVVKALRERPVEEWMQYKAFAKIFKKVDPQAAQPGSAQGNRRDTEMAGESPARKGAKEQSLVAADQEAEALDFNLYLMHEEAFAKFKKAFSTIIGELHVPLAGNLDPKKCKSAEDFALFCQRSYGIKLEK